MAATVNWDPNRYGSTKRVLQYNASTGNYSVVDQDHSYTGVSYNFAALPTGKATTGTTTTGTTTTGTTQAQTTEAFGDVKPWWWNQQGEGKDSANVFSGYQKEKEPVTELSGFFDPLRKASAGQKPSKIDQLRHQAANFGQSFGLSKTDREWADVDRALAGEDDQEGFIKKTTGFVTRPIKKAWKETFKPLALQAIDYITKRPGANKSFRNIAGLYNTEINLMTTYGSTGATDMNPTGDPRKDDAGFNIVSMSGNYNKIGTYSRRHNMLKVADNIIDPIERKKKRNEIRKDWEEEKKTNTENTNYNIDSSGSTDKAPAKTSTRTVHSGKPTGGHHEGGGAGIGSTASKSGPAGGSVGASRFR